MTSPTVPFYFAWVDPEETTFNPATHTVVDENIFSFDMHHEEGQIPVLTLVIRNPRVGLLAPSRKVWAWLSYQPPNNDPVVPIFFGVLEGIPGDIFKELVELKFLARPHTYIEDKQAAAEGLKTFPEYDPIWYDEAHRDDPDSILEGWSALYHVDRITHAVTVSDIISGEDGNLDFAEGDAFYDSVSFTREQAPLTHLRVMGTVKWTQRLTGYVDGPKVNVSSYTGGSFLSEWPKAGANLGSGWHVESSFATDVYRVEQTPQAHFNYHWTNRTKDLEDCSTASLGITNTGPALLSPDPLSCVVHWHTQVGVCDPYSDPQINKPTEASMDGFIVPLWVINATWKLRYERKYQYVETVVIDMLANTQATILSPTVQQHTQLLKVSGGDVGEPLVLPLAWTDVRNQFVPIATIILPNDPTTPGGMSFQIAIQAGNAGSIEPEFSDFPGFVTADNGVLWASLGDGGLNVTNNWTQASPTPLGKIINYQPVKFDEAAGDLIPTGEETFYICLTEGETNNVYTELVYTPPVVSNDEPTPIPQTFVYIKGPDFTTTPGQFIHDGTVVWMCLGAEPFSLEIPIGGTTTHVTARCFFPSDRGQISTKHLICRGRALLRMRARAVKVGWDCPFDAALTASCRKTATLHDPRLPGKVSTGKIIAYSLHAAGDGKLRGKIQTGVAVGLNGTVVEDDGTGVYAAPGYMQSGYQYEENKIVVLPETDIGYTPPAFAPYDDGLNLPLVSLDTVAKGKVSGNLDAQKAAIQAAFPEEIYLENLDHQLTAQLNTDQNGTATGTVVTASILTPDNAWLEEQIKFFATSKSLAYVMAANPISYEILLPPMEGGPFQGAYFVHTTPLEIEKGIDLSAPSSP